MSHTTTCCLKLFFIPACSLNTTNSVNKNGIKTNRTQVTMTVNIILQIKKCSHKQWSCASMENHLIIPALI